MTWAEFKALVNTALTVDAGRVGTEDFIPLQIRLACIDIQKSIPFFTKSQRTVYSLEGQVCGTEPVTDAGEASTGTLPAGVRTIDVSYIEGSEPFNCPCNLSECLDANNLNSRRPVNPFPWDNRFDLISGAAWTPDAHYLICMDRHAQQFFVYPKMSDSDLLEVYWDGVKEDFEDAELVTFDTSCVEAVALWVKAAIKREVENDPVGYALYLNDNRPGAISYVNRKKMLYLDCKDRVSVRQALPSGQPTPRVTNVQDASQENVEIL